MTRSHRGRDVSRASDAKLCWTVMAVVADGTRIGSCYHEHDTQAEAEACPWTPSPWPEVCDLLVCQVRRLSAGANRQLRLGAGW